MNKQPHRWDAEDYARHSAAQQHWAEELISKLMLEGHERLLDIGCGDGKISAHLAGLLARGCVMGIDSSPDMIGLAAASYPPSRYPNLAFRRMDATAIDLPDRFEVVFSNAALHWVRDHQRVLRGVHRCLRPGGRLLFQMGGRGNARDMVEVVESVTASTGWRRYFSEFESPYHFYGVEDYGAWLPASGFYATRIELIPKDMSQNGKAGLKGWLRTTWFPYTDRLPVEMREIFLDEVLDAYAAEHPMDSEGRLHVGMMRLEVEARRA